MAKFNYFYGFSLDVIDDKFKLTCVCGKEFNITQGLFGKSDTIFRCPHCNERWHYESNKIDKTVLLIHPSTNASIPLVKIGLAWIINDDYYRK